MLRYGNLSVIILGFESQLLMGHGPWAMKWVLGPNIFTYDLA